MPSFETDMLAPGRIIKFPQFTNLTAKLSSSDSATAKSFGVPDLNGKAQSAFMALHIVTTGAQAVANTFLGPISAVTSTNPDVQANLALIQDQVAEIRTKLDNAKQTASLWLPGTGSDSGLCATLASTIPGHILDFSATYDAVSDQILDLLKQARVPGANKADLTEQALELIRDGLLASVTGYQTEIAQAATRLNEYTASVQKDHDNLFSGASSLQSLIGVEQSEVGALATDIGRLHLEIAEFNKKIMDAEIGVGVSIFVAVVGVAICATGAGALAGGAILAVGAAGIAASAAVWGVLEAKVHDDENAIASDQATSDQLSQQIISLTALHMNVANAVTQIEAAQSALSDVSTFWATFSGILDSTIAKLKLPNADLSLIMDITDINIARNDWVRLEQLAMALVNTTVTTEVKPALAA